MRRALTSFGLGPHRPLLEIALPTFARYAAEHAYDLFVPQVVPGNRPPSWLKIPLLQWLFRAGYDEVLWLDADVVIRRFDRDIAEDCGEAPMHMVVHHTADGSPPNLGVWYVRRTAARMLADAWDRTGGWRGAVWWEQAAMISTLGGDVEAQKVVVPPSSSWGELPYEWNPHCHDARGVPADCRFFHATMMADRAVAMRRAAGDL
ncbi:MAG: hypothetical protein EB078_03200 [Proteobacteria bacterium]|nr:hypothetical protein [Pseudomonadota bacterium]NDG19275.1 hypothetical protein [Betaproteobacteria bacterium]